MASERVAAILRSRGAPFSEEEIASMKDAEGWAWIYADSPARTKDTREQICFTGFEPWDKERLKELAERMDFRVVTGVTKKLKYLCWGEAPGPVKLAKAKDQGVEMISAAEFLSMAETRFVKSQAELAPELPLQWGAEEAEEGEIEEEGDEEDTDGGTKRSRPRQVVRVEPWEPSTWKFPVIPSFKEALDIKYRVRNLKKTVDGNKMDVYVQEWAQGVPPRYSFKTGDTIATTSYPRDGDPGHVLLQVHGGSPDTWDADEGRVRDGHLTVQVYRPKGPGGGWTFAEQVFVTQSEFVAILKSGVIPKPGGRAA